MNNLFASRSYKNFYSLLTLFFLLFIPLQVIHAASSISLVKSTTTANYTAAGQNIAYNYLVTNTGTNLLTGISITDNKIPTVNISCPSTILLPNVSTTCTATYTNHC